MTEAGKKKYWTGKNRATQSTAAKNGTPKTEEDKAEVTPRDLAPMFQVVAGREMQQVCVPPTINRVEPDAQRANDNDGCEVVEHGLAPNA